MGTSVEQSGRSYGQLLPDSVDRARLGIQAVSDPLGVRIRPRDESGHSKRLGTD
jgi:hypothetical protein